MTNLLVARKVSKAFGGLKAVQDISLEVPRGKIISLIGPNGAGKTTMFNLLSGFYTKDSGSIEFDGQLIEDQRPYDYISIGLARTFQNVRLFNDLTVLDNVMIGNQICINYSPLDIVFNTKKKRIQDYNCRKNALQLLEELGLDHLANIRCNSLPYGEQKKLEIVRAIATSPKLLLLDEPAAGLNPQESEELSNFVITLVDRGITVLLIEHDMSIVMGISDYVYVMDHGVMICHGECEKVQNDPGVIEAYIGKKGMHHAINESE